MSHRPDAAPDGVADEELLAQHASLLGDSVEAAVPAWVLRCVTSRCEEAGIVVDDSVVGAAAVAAGACTRHVVPEMRGLLALDIDDQATTPLSILRRAVSFPTTVLRQIGVPPVARDDFEARQFPEDIYSLSPATFADVDPALAEPGLVWGAAKAHVHLRRRRAEGMR